MRSSHTLVSTHPSRLVFGLAGGQACLPIERDTVTPLESHFLSILQEHLGLEQAISVPQMAAELAYDPLPV